MNRQQCIISRLGRLAPAAALAAVLPFGTPEGRAQPPRPGQGVPSTAEGRVASLTTAPRGEVDGATLDDGTVLHWPPHLADRFVAVVTRGDRVQASGRVETGPEGDTHFEVTNVTNLRTRASAENDFGPPPPPPGPRPGRRLAPPPPPRGGPARAGASSTAEGRVAGLTTAPRGEVDGATLDDGTVLHWPPHLADRFAAVVARGDRVQASGWDETGPAGDSHFEVQRVTNLRTRAIARNDESGPAGTGERDLAAAPSAPGSDAEGRLRGLEDQITQLRAEIQRLLRAR